MNPPEPLRKIILAASGASGMCYFLRLLDLFEQAGCEIHLMITPTAGEILKQETQIKSHEAVGLLGRASDKIIRHDINNLWSPPASGSTPMDAMVVCPCSSHSLAAIAAGLGDNLLLRSAYVTLKQRRPLILVHREMPLTGIDLENMLKINRAGGIICPANPVFYTNPQTISDLVDTVAGRVLDLLGIAHDLKIRYELPKS